MFARLRRAYGQNGKSETEREMNDLKLLGALSAVTDRLEKAVEQIENSAKPAQ